MIEPKRYDEYISTNEVLEKKNTGKFKRYVHSLGYIDGLYGEFEYKRYIPNDKECELLYSVGYEEGKNDRINNSSKIAFTKSGWIEKLAVIDYKNGFRDRHFSGEAQELYDLNYDDLLAFGHSDTITNEEYAKAEKHMRK